MHGTLRPGGKLLDVHPRPVPYRRVEVRIGDRRDYAGRLYRKAFFLADIRAARAALAATVSEGLYQGEDEVEFEHVEHYDSVDSWMSGLSKPRVGTLDVDDRLIDSACALMPDGRGEIIVRQPERAALFTTSHKGLDKPRKAT